MHAAWNVFHKHAFLNPTTISVLVLLQKQEAVLFLNEGQVNRDGKSLNKSDILRDVGYLFAIIDDILSNYGVIWSVN